VASGGAHVASGGAAGSSGGAGTGGAGVEGGVPEPPDAGRTPVDPVLACRAQGGSFCCGKREADGHIYSVTVCPDCTDGACCVDPGQIPYNPFAGVCGCLFSMPPGFGCK
jgi:hypothetical protein